MVIFFNKTRVFKIIGIALPLAFLAVFCGFIQSRTLPSPPDSAKAEGAGVFSTAAETPEGELGFLNQFGINPVKNSRESEDVTIPENFGKAYKQYNEIQKKTGFDLGDYRGRTCSKAVYKLKQPHKTVTLLILDGRVIGAHLSNGVYGEDYRPLNYGKTG